MNDNTPTKSPSPQPSSNDSDHPSPSSTKEYRGETTTDLNRPKTPKPPED